MKTHYGGGGPLDDTKLKGESAFAVAERRGIERNENGDGLFFTLSPANSLRNKLFVFLSWDNDQDLSKSGIDFQDCRAEREREREDLKNREPVWNLNFWFQEKGLYVKHEMAFLLSSFAREASLKNKLFFRVAFFAQFHARL